MTTTYDTPATDTGLSAYQAQGDSYMPSATVSRLTDIRARREALGLFLLALAFLVFLVYPLAWLVQTPLSRTRFLLGLAGLCVFTALNLWVIFRVAVSYATATPLRTPWLALTVLVMLACLLSLAYGVAWFGLFIKASASAGLALRVRPAPKVIVLITALNAGTGLILGAGWDRLGPTLTLDLTIGLLLLGAGQMIETNRALRAARAEIARLAVAEERLRFARDLHDVLGHHLSAIALKTELAYRLLPTAPERAAHEMRDAQTITQDALREMHETIAGYRQPTLAAELSGAGEILDAAGIICQWENTAGTLSPAVDAALAWAVREGVTNVVRHSRAHHCTITVTRGEGTAVLDVVDDGQGGPGLTTHAMIPEENSGGNGLRGLLERVQAHGGSIVSGPLAAGGFHVRVTMPDGDDAGSDPALFEGGR